MKKYFLLDQSRQAEATDCSASSTNKTISRENHPAIDLLRVEQSQKIACTIHDSLDPDDFTDDAERNHIATRERNARILANLWAQAVERR